MNKFYPQIVKLGRYLNLTKREPDKEITINEIVKIIKDNITIRSVNPTPKGQRINDKNYKEKQQILLYPLLGIDMPKFMVNKLKTSIKGFNILTNSWEKFLYECRDGGGRTGAFTLSIIGNYVTFPELEDVDDADTRNLLKELRDSSGQKVYRYLIGKTVSDLETHSPEFYNLYVNYPLTFTVYNDDVSDVLINCVFKNINTLKVPTDYTKLSTSSQPVAEYLRDKALPDFNLGSGPNKDILPLLAFTIASNLPCSAFISSSFRTCSIVLIIPLGIFCRLGFLDDNLPVTVPQLQYVQ